MQKFLFPIIGIILGAIIAFILSSAAVQAQENCPLDWHPPPCGEPPAPVKPSKNIIDAERYHWKMAQGMGVFMAATCAGKTGHPGIDAARMAACMSATFVGGLAVAMNAWEQRVIEQINAARGGGMQYVARLDGLQQLQVMLPDLVLEETGDAYLDWLLYVLQDHDSTIQHLGNLINESVYWTLQCDAWAQTNVQGIYCGNAQRAYTEELFQYMGERYVAVSGVTDAIGYVLAPDIGQGVNEEMVYLIFEDGAWNRYFGQGYQQ